MHASQHGSMPFACTWGSVYFLESIPGGYRPVREWNEYLPLERTACTRTAAQEAVRFRKYWNGIGVLYEEEAAFLKKQEASCVVLARMRNALLETPMGSSNRRRFSPFWGKEEESLANKLYALAQSDTKEVAAQELLGTLTEIESFFFREKTVSLGGKGKGRVVLNVGKVDFSVYGACTRICTALKGKFARIAGRPCPIISS